MTLSICSHMRAVHASALDPRPGRGLRSPYLIQEPDLLAAGHGAAHGRGTRKRVMALSGDGAITQLDGTVDATCAIRGRSTPRGGIITVVPKVQANAGLRYNANLYRAFR
jgi:hypothetical protein